MLRRTRCLYSYGLLSHGLYSRGLCSYGLNSYRLSVNGGRNTDECLKVAYAVAHSPLVKTAFFASDPNLGRILAAVGYAGVDDLDVNGVDVYLDDVQVAHQGGLFSGYTEAQGAAVMVKSDITVRIDLGRGDARDTVWTCDFSHDYVSINADYRS